MTTKQAPLGAERSDLSVLEKLKRINEILTSKDCENRFEFREFQHLNSWYLSELRPRLIAMLEMVEKKAKDSALEVQSISHQQRRDHQRDFARELLAVLEDKEAKDE